jgi:hypothetical protein
MNHRLHFLLALLLATLRAEDGVPTVPSTRGYNTAADGTAALPSITFSSDRDTGFYKYADNVIGVATAGAASISFGAESVTFASGGSITGASGALTLTGATTVTGNLTVSGTGNSSFAGNLGVGLTAPGVRLNVADADNGNNGTLRLGGSSGSGVYGTIKNEASSTGKLVLDSVGSGAAGGISLRVEGTPRLALDNNGTLVVSGTGAHTFGTTNTVTLQAGAVTATGAITFGGGSTIKTVLTATATLDFTEIAAAGSADLTITVTGAAVNDSVSLGLPASPAAGIVWNAFVSATNTVTVRASNITASPVNPASATYRATVTSF